MAMAMGCMGTKTMAMVVAVSLLAACGAAQNILNSGQSLNTGQSLVNGPYMFVMQGDCNLVLYMNSRPLWSSGTGGRGSTCRVVMQGDGNLVIYLGSSAMWASNTVRGPNEYRLVVQGDGNVVIYGAALWATNTVQSSSFPPGKILPPNGKFLP
ncbi:uncharacterized protein LOC143886101 [Tasmannia lanceolata]|uniref:uncharacterized protein LOC143886101 n=1 Tax=Tasmannia lanceolata TaxID=3420 RepID=UPI0040633FAF